MRNELQAACPPAVHAHRRSSREGRMSHESESESVNPFEIGDE